MGWREDYRTASWRGIEFRCGAAGQEGGRRLALHEYPARDLPFAEDTGRRARRFQLDGWIVGPEYNAQRDRLLEACEEQGPGELVHPYRGTLRVSCESVSTRESWDEGGIVRFSFVFVEAGEAVVPAAAPDIASQATAAANATTAAASFDFAEALEVEGVPGFCLDAISDALRGVSSWLLDQQFDGPPGSVARVVGSAGGLVDHALDVAYDPASIAGETVGTIDSVRDAFTSRLAALRALDRVFEVAPPSFTGASALQGVADGNSKSVIRLAQTVALAKSVPIAAEVPWTNLDDALAARTSLEARMDELEGGAADSTYVELQGLRRALTAAVPPPDQALPRLARYTPRRTVSSLVLAWELYGNRARAAELEHRNRIRRPGFVPGGRELEVLSV